MGRRKKKIDEGTVKDIGRVMNVCLFLILLTFFILLNTFAVMDDWKVRKAWGSLIGAFGSLTGGLSPMKTGDSIMPPTAPMIMDQIDVQELMMIMNQEVTGEIKIETGKSREKITIPEKALFHKNKHRLKSSSYPLLNRLCALIRKGKYPVEIIGHSDKRAAEDKGYKTNWELSALMAIQILKYFVEKGGVQPERLSARGAEGFFPIAANDTRQSRELNRRVEIIINHKMPVYFKRIYRKKPSGIFTYKKFIFRISK